MKSVLLVLLASCSSMVDAPCLAGYDHMGNECIARTDQPDAGTHHPDAGTDGPIVTVAPDAGGGAQPDAAIDAAVTVDAPVDAPVDVAVDAPADAGVDVAVDAPVDAAPTCSLDLSTDPDNCGYCGHVCASGLCSASHCTGDPYGHIVAIGHDYAHFHGSATRVIGNAVALGKHHDVGVGFWPDKNLQVANVVAIGTATISRPWHEVAVGPNLDGVDVLVMDDASTELAGEVWKPVLDKFLSEAGVVIVVEGSDRTEHVWARGAGLFTADDPADVTGQSLTLSAPTDSVADGVATPYAAEATTVGFPNLTPAVVTASDGSTVVMHRVR